MAKNKKENPRRYDINDYIYASFEEGKPRVYISAYKFDEGNMPLYYIKSLDKWIRESELTEVCR